MPLCQPRPRFPLCVLRQNAKLCRMYFRILTTSCLALMLPSLSACDGNTDNNTGATSNTIPSGTGPVAMDQLPHEMAVAVCNLLLRCAGTAADEYGGSATACLTEFEKRAADQSLAQLNAAIALGTSSYDPAAMRRCLDVYPQLSCDYSNETSLLAACNDVWQGTVPIGGACTSNYECAGNPDSNYCASDGTCPGHCQARGQLGQTCANDDECDLALECDSSTDVCVNRLKLGDPCGNSTAATGACGGFTHCAQDSSGTYRCQSLFGTAAANEGDICTSGLCASGLVCEATSEQTDGAASPAVMRCQKKASAGGACRYAYGNPCPDGQYCPASYGATSSAQCTPQVAPNQSCAGTYVAECQSGATCSNNVCVAIQRIGGACTTPVNCYSDACSNGQCVAPSDCSR